MFLSVVILGRFTTETHAMALLRQGPTRRHHLHHSPGRSQLQRWTDETDTAYERVETVRDGKEYKVWRIKTS